MRVSHNRIRVDQVLPSFAPHDAIGYHTLEIQRLIRSLDVESEIYADEIKGGMEKFAIPFKKLAREKASSARNVIYQASTGSPIVRTLMDRPERLIINFHNITPKEILGRWDIGVGVVVGEGIKQLETLKDKIAGAISVSEYNKWCLAQEGITANSLVAMPFIPERSHPGNYGELPDSTSSRWLFVGRITPNKAQHDLIKAFSAYVTGWDPHAKLTLVGSVSSAKYESALRALIHALDLDEHVKLTGAVDENVLEQEYGRATVFVCLSDHEGFGFPLVEAMRHDLPIVAYASSAIPETLGTSGILLQSKDPVLVAGAVGMLEGNETLRHDLIARSRSRIRAFTNEVATSQNLHALVTLIPELTGKTK